MSFRNCTFHSNYTWKTDKTLTCFILFPDALKGFREPKKKNNNTTDVSCWENNAIIQNVTPNTTGEVIVDAQRWQHVTTLFALKGCKIRLQMFVWCFVGRDAHHCNITKKNHISVSNDHPKQHLGFKWKCKIFRMFSLLFTWQCCMEPLKIIQRCLCKKTPLL